MKKKWALFIHWHEALNLERPEHSIHNKNGHNIFFKSL